MRTFGCRWLGLGLLTLPLFVCVACDSQSQGPPPAMAEDMASLEAQVNALSRTVAAQGSELVDAKARLARYQAALADVTALKAQVTELAEAFEARDAELDGAREQLARSQAAVKELSLVWTERAVLTSAIAAEAFEQGYVLPFDEDKHLLLKSVGEGVMKLDGAGGIATRGGAHLRSAGSAAMLSVPWTARGELSMVTLIKPVNLAATGPARIVSLSRDANSRNFTLGQEEGRLIVRFRTTSSGQNGSEPTLTSPDGTLTGKAQAVVFVRRGEQNLLFVDGQLVASVTVPGDLSNWDHSMPLLLGNELTADRTWDGDIYKVAFYNRALSDEEAAKTCAELQALLAVKE
ncbi:MAG: LamG-like jellyroll fold domain-containing protein [Phycisphaeraceae bacterium]